MRDAIIDIAALAGLALITIGVWQISPPCALIVLGSLLFGGAVNGARRHGNHDINPEA